MYEIKKRDEYTFNPSAEIILPAQMVLNRPLMNTDLFLGFLLKESSDIVEDFVDEYNTRLKEVTDVIDTSNFTFAFELEYLKSYPELVDQIKSVTLTLLQYKEYPELQEKKQVSIKANDFVHSYLLPSYYELESLTKVLPRKDAIELYKKFVDHRTDVYSQQIIRPVEDLNEMFNLATSSTEGPHGGVAYFTTDGIAGVKQKVCLWHEFLKVFDDSELAYAVACHYDFHAMKYYNEHFVLTRPKTLMEGHGLCDFCWHDTRIVDEAVHPDQAFWDDI